MLKAPPIIFYLLLFLASWAQASTSVLASWMPPAQPVDDEIQVKEYAVYLSTISGTERFLTSVPQYQFEALLAGEYSLQVSAISNDDLEGARSGTVRFKVNSDGSLDPGDGGQGLPKMYLFGELDSRFVIQRGREFSLVEIPSEGTPIETSLGRFHSVMPAITGADSSQQFVGVRSTAIKRKPGFDFATLSEAGAVLSRTKMERVGKPINGCVLNQQPLAAQLRSQGNQSQIDFLLKGKLKQIPLGSGVRIVECLNRKSGLPHLLILRADRKGQRVELLNERGRVQGVPLLIPKRGAVRAVFAREYDLPHSPMLLSVVTVGGRTRLMSKSLSARIAKSLLLEGLDSPIDRALLRELSGQQDRLQLHLKNGQLVSLELQFNGASFVQSGDSRFPLAGKLVAGHVGLAD